MVMKYGTSHVTHSTVCYNSNKNNIFVTGNAHDIFCFWLNTWTKLRSTLRDIFPNVNKLFFHVHSIIAYRTVLNVFQSKMSDKFLFKSPITEIEWYFCGGESLTWITYTIFIYFIHVIKLNDENNRNRRHSWSWFMLLSTIMNDFEDAANAWCVWLIRQFRRSDEYIFVSRVWYSDITNTI